METSLAIMHRLAKSAALIGIPLYWTDLQSRILGANQAFLDAVGTKQPADLVGKTATDYFLENNARTVVDHIDLVIQTGRVHTHEERIRHCRTGQIRHFFATRAPLMGAAGKIIGVLGTMVDIPEVERVQPHIAADTHKDDFVALESIVQMVNKAAHDIRSPLTAMAIMLGQCNELDEARRIPLKAAFSAVQDIANNMLNRYIASEIKPTKEEAPQLVLCSDFLHNLISEKKYQYLTLPVKFSAQIEAKAQFVFIYVQPSQFRRAMSNFISNAVDACKNRANARVTIHLDADDTSVRVTIQDNGKGMSRKTLEKMLNRVSFTADKEDGHGLGMMQIWDMVDYSKARLDVSSHLGGGTTSTLIFSRAQKADWVMDEVHFKYDDIVVILDDDPWIHDAWDMRIKPLLKLIPKLTVRHERQGQAVLDYVGSLDPKQKQRINLLCDFELIGQSRNGLQVIEAGKIDRAILVTNYYHQRGIQESALKLGIRILPKQMAAVTPIWYTQRFGLHKINLDYVLRDMDDYRVEQMQDELYA
jgi:PAS domain S-box-containing protein